MNLVNELQVSTEKDDVLTVLRKAKRLASKLGVTDIDLWLRCEQEGYVGGTEIPAYRTVKGTLVYNSNGYIPVGWGMIGEGIMDFPGNLGFDRRLPDAMSEVASMIEYARQKGHGLYYPLEESDFTRRCRGMMHPLIANKVSFLLRLSTGNIQSIPDAVKDRVLDWACALERRGVLGENMTFSDREKEQAHTLRLDLTNCTIQQLGTIDNKGLVKMSDDRNSLRNSGTLSVGRDLVQARDITRSFNALADKAEGREVADKLRQLALSLNGILTNLQADQAERLAKDAEKFAEEAAEEPPAEGGAGRARQGSPRHGQTRRGRGGTARQAARRQRDRGGLRLNPAAAAACSDPAHDTSGEPPGWTECGRPFPTPRPR